MSNKKITSVYCQEISVSKEALFFYFASFFPFLNEKSQF
jgi:hypothetical protein